MMKRVFTLLLALTMLVTLIPAAAFPVTHAEGTKVTEAVIETQVMAPTGKSIGVMSATVSYRVEGTLVPAAFTPAIPAATNHPPGAIVAVAPPLTSTSLGPNGEFGTWTFHGWTAQVDVVMITDDRFEMPGSNVEFTGRWTFEPSPTFTVSYTVIGALVPAAFTPAIPANANHPPGATVAVAPPLTSTSLGPNGEFGTWTFHGWIAQIDIGMIGDDRFEMPGSDVEFIGYWTFEPNEIYERYTVSYTVIGALVPASFTPAVPVDASYPPGTIVTVAPPLTSTSLGPNGEMGEWVFHGWIAQVDTGMIGDDTFEMPSHDVRFTGYWTFIPHPEGMIDKQADRRVALIGTPINYTIIVTNESEIDMTDFVVEDALNNLVEFVVDSLRVNGAVSATATYIGGVIRVPLETLKPGDSVTITFQVIVLDQAVGEVIENTAYLRHEELPDLYATAEVEVEVLYIRPNPVHYAYLIGRPSGWIYPGDDVTRAETATIFFRLICDQYRINIWSQANPFSDVPLPNWYNNAVSTMANAGFLLGRPDGTFGPNDAITRAEFATIISRFMNVTHTGGDLFPDIAGHWAADAINAAAYVGWVLGDAQGNFRPNDNLTRAEAATIVNRIFLRHLSAVDYSLPGLVSWPDNANPLAWYYLHIKEATNSNHHEMLACGVYKVWTALIPPRNWSILERPYSDPGDIL